jgi:hypothetical protein
VAPSGTTHTEMTTSVDAYGKQKQTWNTDTYTVVAGEAKVGRTVSEKKLTEAGGKVTVSTVSKLDYAYDDQGKLTGAIKTAVSEVPVAPSGTTHTEMTTSVDAYGKQKQTWNTDTYTVVGDEAKLGRTISERKLTEADGKVTTSTVSKIDYAYDGEGKLAGATKTAVSDVPEAPSGTAHTEMTQEMDAYGNQTQTWNTQIYTVVGDEAKLARTISETKLTEADGKMTTSTVSKIDYAYDEEGKLAGATKTAVSEVPEAPSGISYTEMAQTMDQDGKQTKTWSTETYAIIGGEARKQQTSYESVSLSEVMVTSTSPYSVTYSYDSLGNVTSVTTTNVYALPDPPSGMAYPQYAKMTEDSGRITETWSKPTFEVVVGKVWKVSQVNEIRVEDIDGTVTITNEDVVYCDPANGDFSC